MTLEEGTTPESTNECTINNGMPTPNASGGAYDHKLQIWMWVRQMLSWAGASPSRSR